MTTLIFDIDGTLIDSVAMYLRGLQQTMRRYNRTYSITDLRFSNGIPSSATAERLGFTGEAATAMVAQWTQDSQAFADTVAWFPGLEAALAELTHRNVAMGLVTSKNTAQYDVDAQRFGFSRFFQTVVRAHDAPRSKPFGDPIELAMSRLNATPQDAVYIGDTETDAQAAQAAGVPFALCTWTTPAVEAPVAHYLKAPADLLTLA
ncbi:HAD family hydrolase [Lacticaseibacillus parakribbianus]|uniref:HAD family hydrolase n=1 Tax=Lacticaseibacillus parakribbianus TaxID=2970927 RepID=UPI0021CB1D21|nr:HAD family hydrolase [Lacticaseibacillus parakribbianus]